MSIEAFIKAVDVYGINSDYSSIESFFLIWFDPNIENVKRTSKTLSRINGLIRYFLDLEQCVAAIHSIKTSKIVLVVAAEVFQSLLPCIKSCFRVDSVLIYCNESDKSNIEQNKHPKVFDVYSNLDYLVSGMEHPVKQLDQHLKLQRLFGACKSDKDVILDFGNFLWLHTFIEAARRLYWIGMKKDNSHQLYKLFFLAQTYYRGDSKNLEIVYKFRENYRPEDAIRWYTETSFPYKMMNKAFRTEKFDLIFPFLFFILDLKESLTREHCKLEGKEEKLVLYRGSTLRRAEVERLKHMAGELISINGFLSTSRSRPVAEAFSGTVDDFLGNTGVIFEIECDLSLLGNMMIFADVAEFSRKPDEKEVLFDISSVFRLQSIEEDSEGTWILKMMGTTEVSSLVKKYVEYRDLDLFIMENPMREVMSFGSLLSDQLRYERAQEHLEKLLDKPNGEEIAALYATKTRAEKLVKDHEILMRDHYDYTRDRLSTGDFRRLARTLNRIGFFLPRNDQIRDCPHILQLLEVNENLSNKSTEIRSLVSVLPYFGDDYRHGRSWMNCATALGMPNKTHQDMSLALLTMQQLSIDDGDGEGALKYQQLASRILEDNCDDEAMKSLTMEAFLTRINRKRE